jgi:hypothetical protein
VSDFSDRPFVAGSLIGLRAFAVDDLGRLSGPAFGGIFKPDENVATCGGDSPYGKMNAQLNPALRASWTFTIPTGTWTPVEVDDTPLSETAKAPVRSKQPPHVVAGVNCGCGYYAYFNGDNTYAQTDRVSAVVEGYGVCTVGDRGFRASKARLVALVLPDTEQKSRDRHARHYDSVYPELICRPRAVAVNTVQIRRNYPDVPVYPTVAAALAEHPLTPPKAPPRPTPETDEDFWTRPAS